MLRLVAVNSLRWGGQKKNGGAQMGFQNELSLFYEIDCSFVEEHANHLEAVRISRSHLVRDFVCLNNACGEIQRRLCSES